jgi:DNA-directed RNA polymerase subunit RPC12/RpoP
VVQGLVEQIKIISYGNPNFSLSCSKIKEGIKMTDGKICPKCSKKDLNLFCGEAIKQLNGGPKISTEEWNKTHKIPEMVFNGNLTEFDVYKCPICGYVELWGEMRAKPK